ncbi:MAG: hypothetical protein GKR95_25620 [Gammaproteobacteria bacterium]|nr:hypothetical protein [Gammaproteobacteria bacterium]NKB65336.1 hypothetical protein [Gammaproteobacteria bacterium]
MLTKILFTLLVIIGVAFFFRTKNQASQETPQGDGSDITAKPLQPISDNSKSGKSLPTKTVAYLLLAILIGISILIFIISSNNDNRIVNIRIIGDSGVNTTYQARQKTIEGRSFETLDGTMVTLGESDRIEMIEQ